MLTPQVRFAVRIMVRAAMVAAVLLVVGNVAFVAADNGGQVGQTIPTLSWIQLSDDKGISLWNYELTINYQSDIFNPGATISAWFTELLWRGYLGCSAVAIWFLDWVLSFDWLTIITGPLLAIGEALRDVIARFGLVPAFLAVAALGGAMFIMRGKIARGVYEMLVGAFVVALSATALSNPIQMVAGPGGWIFQARDHTLQVVAAMGDQAHTDQNAITSELITTFIRQPVQLVSFGQILDGTACESVYDAAIRSGPHGYDATVRDAVKGCSEAAGVYAETPSGSMVASVLLQSPAGLVVLTIAILIGGTVMLALVSTVLASLKVIINVLLAVLPGGARRPLAQAFAEMFIGIATFVFAMFFLAVYLMVIQTVFRAHDGEPSKAFVITIIFMLLGLVAFLRYRRSLKAATDRLTQWMSQRPSGGAPRPLAPAGGGSQWMKAAGLYGAGKVLASPQGRTALKNTAVVGAAALTGNPALASRVLLNNAAAKKAKGVVGRTMAGKPATPATATGTATERTVFSGRGTPRRRGGQAPAQHAAPHHHSDDEDTVALEGTIVEEHTGPRWVRLPMRRPAAQLVTPQRPTRLRPAPTRPELPPPPPPTTKKKPRAPKPPRPATPAQPAAARHTTRRPQQERAPRTTPNPGRPQNRALRRPQRRTR